MTTTQAHVETILGEARDALAQIDPKAAAVLATEIAAAGRTLLYGAGRNGLVLQAFAMRLMHLGLNAHFVGQLAAPPIGKGDLFVAAAAVGTLPTVDALAATARRAGARVAILTARPEVVPLSDVTVLVLARTMASAGPGPTPLGSAFELVLHLLCEATVLELMARLGKTSADLARNHTNLL